MALPDAPAPSGRCELSSGSPEGSEPRRLTLVIHGLEAGGAERISSILANGLSGRGWTVTILTLNGEEPSAFYALAPSVVHEPLGLGRTTILGKGLGRLLPAKLVDGLKRIPLSHLWNFAAKAWRLRKGIRHSRPDVVLAFIDVSNILTLLATLGLCVPVVISERNDPAQTSLGWIWRLLRDLTYPRAASLVVLSDDTRAWFPARVRRRIQVIPNPVLPPPEGAAGGPGGEKPGRIIAVGRLSREKGFDVLLEAFARTQRGKQGWNLEIWGEGALRSDLEALRDRLGLHEQVSLPGLTQSIHARYASADIFVLSSRTEGFPNALCEAMSHAIPVVATSCSGGVREILRPGLDGLLVPPEDPEAMAQALSQLMNRPSLRRELGQRAAEVTRRFSLGAFLDRWDRCLQDASHDADC